MTKYLKPSESKIMRVVNESEIPDAERGWYVVDVNNSVLYGPYDMLWQARESMESNRTVFMR